ncbi:MAG: endonuclease/exonuclease/phosphatase family protein [Parvularcula sp.]|nr:endonuclease/exonuclease/phosphatase family protein [Parvularcula sp.]
MVLAARSAFILAALLLLIALVSLLPSDAWFVRVADFVREPMAYAAAILMIIALFLASKLRGVTITMLSVAIVINVWMIWPYSALAGSELELGADKRSGGEQQCFTAMSANVKIKNDNYAAMSEQIRLYDPDVLFLMETDDGWIDALEPIISAYPHAQAHPQSEAFGMVFATRLPLAKSRIVENTHRDTPTLYATLLPQGLPPVEFIGLHPKPPLPGWNTEERDRNIINAGSQTPDRLPNALVMGDFNDVPWSRTTTRFRTAGEWRDPRIGRGTYPTFPARLLAVGWPLDQIMLKGELQLHSFKILPNNGSDHRAVIATICPPW